MTFDDLWPLLVIPGEFDAMDLCDQRRWRGVLEQAFDEGVKQGRRDCAEWSESRSMAWLRIADFHEAEGDARRRDLAIRQAYGNGEFAQAIKDNLDRKSVA